MRELVKADGGTVVLDDAPEGGLRVAITLPLAAPAVDGHCLSAVATCPPASVNR